MRRLAVAALIAVSTLLALPLGAAAQDGPQGNRPDLEQQFVTKINQLRADRGLPALAVHEQLVAKARQWSDTMAAAGNIWHSNLPDGITANWRRLGENVGMGGSVDSLHDAFVASPHHYENLVDPGFRYVGIGVTVDSKGTIFVSQEFMELASQPAPAAPAPAAGTPPSTDAAPAPPPAPPAPAPKPAPVERARSVAAARTPAAAPAAGPVESRVESVLDRLRIFDGV